MKLLNAGNNKTIKGEAIGYRTYGIHLAPSKISGYNTCPYASKGCALACLNTAGRGIMKTVQQARIDKTKMFFEDREAFMEQLIKEITSGIKSAKRAGLKPCFRLNLTSDISWEKLTVAGEKTSLFDKRDQTIFDLFPDVTFYDYTKSMSRAKASQRLKGGCWPSNYHLTYSRSEVTNDDWIKKLAHMGVNTAVVFRGQLPEKYLGLDVVSGDETDLRFLDKKGVVVGLTEKGLAKKDETGFVVEPALTSVH